MIELAQNRQQCMDLGYNAKQRIEQSLNSEQTIIKYKELYESLI